ncbi:hypothetical protein PANDA_007197 [Ailuropoda melanoleuca]|uniref:Heparan-sulfate 6-O-sulfotransferase n=1 Tax=Ailuropoda melanoleuca TaxID=9646 RepID=D2HA00_AILME|nr:hypothetical protein PANDA_007197 [Ailuropoda melanoleuca]
MSIGNPATRTHKISFPEVAARIVQVHTISHKGDSGLLIGPPEGPQGAVAPEDEDEELGEQEEEEEEEEEEPDPEAPENGSLPRFVPRFNFTLKDLTRFVDFNIKGRDVIVFLHIQKTGGTTFGRHLVKNIRLEQPCSCKAGQKKCTCHRPGKKETWLFSRFSTGWSCGLHADWTELTNCVPAIMEKKDCPRNHSHTRYSLRPPLASCHFPAPLPSVPTLSGPAQPERAGGSLASSSGWGRGFGSGIGNLWIPSCLELSPPLLPPLPSPRCFPLPPFTFKGAEVGQEVIPGVKKVKECRGQDVGWIIRGNVEVKNDGKHGLEEEVTGNVQAFPGLPIPETHSYGPQPLSGACIFKGMSSLPSSSLQARLLRITHRQLICPLTGLLIVSDRCYQVSAVLISHDEIEDILTIILSVYRTQLFHERIIAQSVD